MAMTGEELTLRSIRKEQLLRQIRELEKMISGRKVSLAGLLAGADGRPDLRRVRGMAEELAAEYALFRKPPVLDEEDREDITADLEQETTLMTEPEQVMVRTFFFCALRLLADCPWLDGTVEELLRFAQKAQQEKMSRRALELEEVRMYEMGYSCRVVGRGLNFFMVCDEVYELLSGEHIALRIPAEYRAKLMEFLQDELDADAEKMQEYDFLAEFGGMTPEEIAEEYGVPEEFAEDALAEYPDDGARTFREEAAAWVAGFEAPDEFCREYLAFRDAYFTEEDLPADFAATAERAVDLYLGRHKLNHFADDRVYFSTRNLLDQAITKVSRIIAGEERARAARAPYTKRLPGGGVL